MCRFPKKIPENKLKKTFDYNYKKLKQTIIKDLDKIHLKLSSTTDITTFAEEKLYYILYWLENKKVVIYGAGKHTKKLKEIIINSPAKIVAIMDDNPCTKQLFDIPVIQTKDMNLYSFDAFIVSSDTFEYKMLDNLKKLGINENMIFLLYDLQKQ